MPETDHPLKELILAFKEAFAAWLLGQPTRRVEPLNIELLASAQRSDLVFEVEQADGQVVILHIELQGRGSETPMPLRMLDYMSRLTRREGLLGTETRLVSVVLYAGHGAGRGDDGQHAVLGRGDQASLSWQYEVVRLWEIEGETLLGRGEPALLALIGQTRLSDPARELPQVLAEIRGVADERQRGRLLTALVSLLRTEEVIEMVERMLDASDELLLDLPYLRRVREQGREEGLVKGRESGKEEGLAEGLVKGRETGKEEGLAEGLLKGKAEGMVEGLREAILETITLRFNPPALEYRRVSQDLATIADRKTLQILLATAIQAAEMTTFLTTLAEMVGPE